MVGVAVKVTSVPAHTLFASGTMVTDGTSTGLTVTFTEFDVTVCVVAHVALDVSTHVTASTVWVLYAGAV